MATDTNNNRQTNGKRASMKKVFGLTMHTIGTGLNVVDNVLGTVDTSVDSLSASIEDGFSMLTNETRTMRESSDNQRLIDQEVNANIYKATKAHLSSDAGKAKIASVAEARVTNQLDEMLAEYDY